ncbi:MAG TPA: sensor domain-containing diguanylate cyclase [Candidatus Sulfobium mesophilum]|nr:sensor domain-containing diguanylate cyclase [Candidatus Sulfobium mesophilum]
MKRQETAILARNSTILTFLTAFFGSSRTFKPVYFKEPDLFLEYLGTGQPAVIIVEGSLLKSVHAKTANFPSVSIIAGDVTKGVENALTHNVRNYLYRPYIKRDLQHKLESVIHDKEVLDILSTKVKQLEAVLELTQFLSSTLDSKELLFKIVSKISEIMPVTRCSVISVNWARRSAYVVATFEDPKMSVIKLSLKKYPEIVAALTSRKPVVIQNTETDPRMRSVKHIISPLGIRSILVIPIFFRDKVIGTLFLRTSRAEHAFTENEIKLLNAIAGASASALNTAFLFEQVEDEKTRLEKLSLTDFLTSIYNIRYFYTRIIEEFSRSQRYAMPISCLMLDVDYFKKINDKFGHKTGDMVLKEFASLLKKHSRKSDVLARYGGEEFIMLLPQTSLKGALAEAERIRRIVGNHKFKSIPDKERLTISVGIAVSPDKRISTHDDLISFADQALFVAKNSGRNRVASFGK